MAKWMKWVSSALVFAALASMPAQAKISKDGMLCLYGFEPGEKENWVLTDRAEVSVTKNKKEVISGLGSLKADSMARNDEWNEFLWTDIMLLPLVPQGKYTVYFRYTVLKKEGDCYFYFLTRSQTAGPGPADKGWTNITDEEGGSNFTIINIDLDDYTDYYVIIGIYKKGAIIVDDFAVFKGEMDEDSIDKAIKEEKAAREKKPAN